MDTRVRPGDVVLFDPRGRKINATATVSAWRGGRQTRRTRNWQVTDASINALLSGEVAAIRARTRDVVRKSPFAASGLDGFAANAVGDGIVPRPAIRDDELRRIVMEAWEDFVEQADADGVTDFYGLQALICRAFREGGDAFVRLRPRRAADNLAVPLQLQGLEAEMLDPAYEEYRPNGFRIQAGIEFDALGRRVGYHFHREHPGEFYSMNPRAGERVFVPSANVLHVYQVLRPGQIRGVPGFSASLAKLWDFELYDDAERTRKQVSAMFAGFVRKPDANSNPLDAGTSEGFDHDDRPLAVLEPGTMQELAPGEDVEFSKPPDVGNSYGEFMAMQLRQVAVESGLTYEQLTGDLSGVNFSSIRAGLIEMRRRMSLIQRNVLIFQLCRPVWRRFMEAALLSGRIPMPTDPIELAGMFRVSWTCTPGREYVDPEKEVRATIAKLRAGLMSRSRAVAEHGFDAEALDREIAADNARADHLGLRFDGDGRTPVAGAPPMAPPKGDAASDDLERLDDTEPRPGRTGTSARRRPAELAED